MLTRLKLKQRFQLLLAALSIRIDDHNRGWTTLSTPGPTDRPLGELQQDLYDTLEAWRKNFLIRQVVRLTTAYVVGDGIRLTSKVPAVDSFIQAFWNHPENHLTTRLSGLCDELTRSGELFPLLFTNRYNGMSQVRFIPASTIVNIETDPHDYEKELFYHQALTFAPGLSTYLANRIWKSWRVAKTTTRQLDPLMLHFAVNQPIGSTRGESDLIPILPWATRYTEWLKDRVRFNRLCTELSAVDIEIEDDSKVVEKRKQYEAYPPKGGNLFVHGRGEKVSYPAANIQGFEAEPDGRALRLAFAAGANVPLHFLAEGSSATRSTAQEMGDPTHRHYRMRQKDFSGFLVTLATTAYRRFERLTGQPYLDDLAIEPVVPDVSRADNTALADAAYKMVQAAATMKQNGWLTDQWAIELCFKFAGELITEEEILSILNGENNGIS